MNRLRLFLVAGLGACLAACAAQAIAPITPQAEQNLINDDPSNFYTLAGQLWTAGKKDDAVFWLYVGELRYRFYLQAHPELDPSGAPALFASLQEVVGKPINLYAGHDPKQWVIQINAALDWDGSHDNGFTSKVTYREALIKTRAGLVKLRDYIDSHQQEILAQREQNGVGDTGVNNGVYTEEQVEKMPKDWPALNPDSNMKTVAGVYKASFEALLGPTLFFVDQYKVGRATSFDISFPDPKSMLVIARNGDQELLRRTIQVKEESGAVVFKEDRTAEEAGLATGGDMETVYLRTNAAGELVIQRDSLTQGTYPNKTMPVRLHYGFWNRAKRQ